MGKVHYLPELEILPFDRKSPTRDIQASIQAGLHALDSGDDGFFVTTIYGLRHKVMEAATLRKARLELRTGEAVDTDELGESSWQNNTLSAFSVLVFQWLLVLASSSVLESSVHQERLR